MEEERVELEADIEKLHHTLEEEKNQWQYDYIVDSDDDDSDDEEEEDALYIDLEKHGSAAASLASISARSAGGRTTPSVQSTGSHPTTETQSIGTEQDDDSDLFREVGVVLQNLDSTAGMPATLESCLVVNRTYQDIITDHISRIELELAENREAQKNIEEEAKESKLQQWTKKRFPYNATLPYFKMKYGSTPSYNEDTRLKQITDEPDLDRRPDPPWYAAHKRLLTQAVMEDAMEKLLQPLLSKRELEEEKLSHVGENTDQWHEINKRIAQIDLQVEEKKETSSEELLQNVDPERVDWMKISNKTFEGRRDWMACHRAWLHSVNPKLNHRPITRDEESELIRIIHENNSSDWVDIAYKLGTGRTPFQCLQYYQQNLNTEMLNRPWTREEDEQLLKVVEKCQLYHFNWRKVSQYMEGRSGMQCYKRYSKLDPNINKGHWTEAEDAQLMTAVQLVGTQNWGRVHELVPGRTREQCRERYVNSLDPGISGKSWTYDEDKKLLELVAKHGKGNWVKCCKELPGRTDNQVLQRYRRLEDWKKKTEWFKKQSHQERDLLQGNNLPPDLKVKAQERNWEQFKIKFGVVPDDYRKQQRDIDKGDIVVPRPPFMIGLASKSGCRVWERRIKLHKLIEGHIDKLKEKFNFINPSVAGVFELQDAISQLSKDCLSQREQLMNQRKDRLGQLIHGLPSHINVKDLLAVSRGGNVSERIARGPNPRKKKNIIPPRLHQSMKVEAELRRLVRANLKDRSLKKGRPRRFFWDLSGEQVLSDEDLAELKSTTFSLYLKSLGVDLADLLRAGRKTYPQLFHKLQQEQLQSSGKDQDEEQPSTSDNVKSLRRSVRKRKQKEMEIEEAENTDPFSVSGMLSDSMGFAEFQRQRDYELLEWLARSQSISVDDQLAEEVSMAEEIPAAAASVEVGSITTSSRTPADPDRPVIGHGMSLVHASIQQAMEEQEAQTSQDNAASTSTAVSGNEGGDDADNASSGDIYQILISGGGDASNTAAVSLASSLSAVPVGVHTADAASTSQVTVVEEEQRATSTTSPFAHPSHPFQPTPSTSRSVRASRQHSQVTPPPPQQFPNLPPTRNSIQSFKNLLLKRLGLIKKAGGYYDLSYYLAKKDYQMARLIKAGNRVQELNRGTIDLSRMMNRISQETNYAEPYKRRRRKQPENAPPLVPLEDSKNFDHRVLEAVRKTEQYRLLQARFQAVFTWPALLSAIYPPFQRKDYSDKAGGKSYLARSNDLEYPNFQVVRKLPPMVKTKGFYRFANKPKDVKATLHQKRHERRILRQVQGLLADENDPKPEVAMYPESDDDTNTNRLPESSNPSITADPQPGTSNTLESSEDASSEPPPRKKRKRYKKRDPNAQPVRQSSRVTHRKTYVDSINRKRTAGPRKPKSSFVNTQKAPASLRVRPPRLQKSVRLALIDAIKEYHKPSCLHGTQVGQWNPGGYVSDENNDIEEEIQKEGSNWVMELPPEQQDNLAVLERESIVDKINPNSSTEQVTMPDNLMSLPTVSDTASMPAQPDDTASILAQPVSLTCLPANSDSGPSFAGYLPE